MSAYYAVVKTMFTSGIDPIAVRYTAHYERPREERMETVLNLTLSKAGPFKNSSILCSL
ncbi:hypothetical protein KIN20_026046 [Parelaphostrongylus tenuis]|uniref:Uncharacterized protein n=1 Tax=Parelaphostrongylus tenuis TaxID=148309 RepID=A0AAD5MZ37_PARTN|nr:hypothetical protein KIN20_026046 [Parelaphostrongylus tenuis]